MINHRKISCLPYSCPENQAGLKLLDMKGLLAVSLQLCSLHYSLSIWSEFDAMYFVAQLWCWIEILCGWELLRIHFYRITIIDIYFLHLDRKSEKNDWMHLCKEIILKIPALSIRIFSNFVEENDFSFINVTWLLFTLFTFFVRCFNFNFRNRKHNFVVLPVCVEFLKKFN